MIWPDRLWLDAASHQPDEKKRQRRNEETMDMNMVTVLATAGKSASGASTTQGLISMLVIYAAIIGVFWFFAIRPQKKQQKEHETLLTTLEVGDSILTTSGFFGVVIDIMEEIVVVEFGNDKHCRIPMKKENIVEIDKQSSSR